MRHINFSHLHLSQFITHGVHISPPSPDGPMGKTLASPRGGQGFESRRVSIRGGHGLVFGSGFLDSAYYNGQRPGHPGEPVLNGNTLLKSLNQKEKCINFLQQIKLHTLLLQLLHTLPQALTRKQVLRSDPDIEEEEDALLKRRTRSTLKIDCQFEGRMAAVFFVRWCSSSDASSRNSGPQLKIIERRSGKASWLQIQVKIIFPKLIEKASVNRDSVPTSKQFSELILSKVDSNHSNSLIYHLNGVKIVL
ncbi:hypothetical protein LXL04_001597 [Taraxacum kok-saghyz]